MSRKAQEGLSKGYGRHKGYKVSTFVDKRNRNYVKLVSLWQILLSVLLLLFFTCALVNIPVADVSDGAVTCCSCSHTGVEVLQQLAYQSCHDLFQATVAKCLYLGIAPVLITSPSEMNRMSRAFSSPKFLTSEQ